MRTRACICALVLACTSLSSQSPAQDFRSAQGTAFWAVVPGSSVQDLVASATGLPRFAIGVQRSRIRYGLGLGILRASVSQTDSPGGGTSSKDETSATLVQLGPTVILEIWRSTDARTRGNFSGGVSVGRVSASDRSEFTDPSGTTVTESKATGTLLGLHAALGGDYFLSPNFALGAEAGVQGSFGVDLKAEGTTGESFGLSAAGTYAAVRVTLVFGTPR